MDKKENIYLKLLGLNLGLIVLTALSAALFCSLMFNNGYQLYYTFLLIPLLTIGQFFKIYFLFQSNTSTILFLVSILMTFAFFIPLSDAWTHNIKITYPVSVLVYSVMTAFYTIETLYFNRKSKLKKIIN